MNIVCFHKPDEENGYLSNWHLSDFVIGCIKYSSMEQYMMHSKARYFHDEAIAKEILMTNDVAEIKDLGRKVAGYDENIWNGLRQLIPTTPTASLLSLTALPTMATSCLSGLAASSRLSRLRQFTSITTTLIQVTAALFLQIQSAMVQHVNIQHMGKLKLIINWLQVASTAVQWYSHLLLPEPDLVL